jgi:hypothetical protein
MNRIVWRTTAADETASESLLLEKQILEPVPTDRQTSMLSQLEIHSPQLQISSLVKGVRLQMRVTSPFRSP